MESQTEAKSEAKSDPPVVSKQELDEMIPEEINGGIITATNIEIKKEPREEETNTTEVNQSTMDFENFIGNNDPINIKSEDVNTIIDTDEKETYQHMMIGAGISLEDEVEKKPQLNLKGEVIDMEPGDVKDEPAEESSESSSSEEDSSEESPLSEEPANCDIDDGYHKNSLWDGRIVAAKKSLKTRSQNKQFICDTCGYQTDRLASIRQHILQHKSLSEVKSYKCPMCPKRFKYKMSCQGHIRFVHADPTAPKKFSCGNCEFKTNRKSSLEHHLITHSDFAIQKKPKIDLYKCDVCDFKSTTKWFVEKHQNIHLPPSEVELYKCELCPYTSKFKNGVASHMTVHKKPSETTLYECEVCPYKSKWPHCLRNHLKTHKKKEVPIHKCEHCNFKANNKYSVATHKKRTHKELFKKPKVEYLCDQCDYKCKCKGDLTRHKLVHKKLSDSEMFTCYICGAKLKTKDSIKFHIFTIHRLLKNIEVTNVNSE